MPTSDQDTEIVIGTGKMLALFFGLVLMCAFFFAVGFSFGKKTMSLPSPAGAAAAGTPAAVVRPSAAKNNETQSPASNLSFYKSVEQKTADSSLTPPQPQAAAADSAKPDASPTSNASAGSYFVQVAAVSRQEDADALVEALKKKQYPAFAAANGSDRFIRVQVGPYSDLKEAEAMRARLISDGYTPIVKR